MRDRDVEMRKQTERERERRDIKRAKKPIKTETKKIIYRLRILSLQQWDCAVTEPGWATLLTMVQWRGAKSRTGRGRLRLAPYQWYSALHTGSGTTSKSCPWRSLGERLSSPPSMVSVGAWAREQRRDFQEQLWEKEKKTHLLPKEDRHTHRETHSMA